MAPSRRRESRCSSPWVFLISHHGTTNDKDSLILAPPQQSAVCSARVVLEVGSPFSLGVNYLTSPPSERGSIRYRERRVVLERGTCFSRKNRGVVRMTFAILRRLFCLPERSLKRASARESPQPALIQQNSSLAPKARSALLPRVRWISALITGFSLVLTAKGYIVTIRLAPVVPTEVAIAQFPSVKAATEAVIEILNTGVNIRGCYHLPHSKLGHNSTICTLQNALSLWIQLSYTRRMSQGQRGTNMTSRTTYSSSCRARHQLRWTTAQRLYSRLLRNMAARSLNERSRRKRVISSGKTARTLSSLPLRTLAGMLKAGSRMSGIFLQFLLRNHSS